MLKLAVLLMLASVVDAQTLRLRYGGENSSFRITAISAGTPAVVTVKNNAGVVAHTISNAQAIYIHSLVGCQNANGYFKTKNVNQGAGTFELTTTSDVNVTCASAFNATWGSGWVGPVHDVTLNPHPRIVLPPASSAQAAYRTRATDPGIGVSPMAAENGPGWAGTIARLAGRLDVACDGVLKALCPVINSNMGDPSIPTPLNDSYAYGYDFVNFALAWYGDNSNTKHLNALKYLYNNLGRAIAKGQSGANNTSPSTGGWATLGAFGCADDARHCGHSSGADWLSLGILGVALSYDLVESQMTLGEKQSLANKIFNCMDSMTCVNPMQVKAGTVSVTSGSNIITGVGTSFLTDYAANQPIYLRTSGDNTGRVHWITTVNSDTQITSRYNSDVNAPNILHYSINQTWSDDQDGAFHVVGGHIEHVGAMHQRYVVTTTSAVDASTTTIPVNSTADLPSAFPYYMKFYITVYGTYETVQVTAKTSTTLTVVRGALNTTAASHVTARDLLYAPIYAGAIEEYYKTLSPMRLDGNWRSNVNIQKQTGYLAACFAFADVDARAADCSERTFNEMYDLTYPYQKDYWTGMTQGGQTPGYFLGRFPAQQTWLALLSANAFTPDSSVIGRYYFRPNWVSLYLTRPGKWSDGPISSNTDPWQGNRWMSVPLAQAYWAGEPETTWINYWYRNLANFHGTSYYQGSEGFRTSALAAIYMLPSDAATDIRGTEPTWRFMDQTDTDTIIPNGGANLLSSKTGFGDSDATVWMTAFEDIQDHNLDWAFVPASYYIMRGTGGGNNEYFIADNATYGIAGNPGSATNWFEVDSNTGALQSSTLRPSWFTTSDTCSGFIKPWFDQKGGNTSVVWARVFTKTSFCTDRTMTRGYRYLTHWKGVGANDAQLVIAYDNYAKGGAAKGMRTRLHNYRNDEPGLVPTGTGTSYSFVKSSGRNNVQVLFPLAQSPTITASTSAAAYTFLYDFGSVTGAQMVAVHYVSPNTADTGGTAALLASTDSNSWAVDFDMSITSRTVVWDRADSLATSRNFTTTRSSTGECLVTGLAAGLYDFSGSVSGTILSSQTVSAGSNSLHSVCNGAQVFTASQTGSIAPVVFTTLQLPDGTENVAYSASFGSCSGGTPPYTYALQSGTLHTGLSVVGNTVVGTPTTTGTQASLVFRCSDSQAMAETEDSTAQSLLINAAAVALQLSGPTSATFTLGGSCFGQYTALGGTPAYTYSATGLPTGCSISSSTGLVSGTPSIVGTFMGQACVDDTIPNQACVPFTFNTQTTDASVNVSATVSNGTALIKISRAGLDANLECIIVARDQSNNQVGSVTVAKGPATRTVAMALDPLSCPGVTCEVVSIQVSCGASLGGLADNVTVTQLTGSAAVIVTGAHATANNMLVDYGLTSALGSSTSATCSAGRCAVTLSDLTRGSAYYIRHTYRDVSNNALATGAITPHLVQ